MLRCLSHIDYQYKQNKKIYELFAQKIKNIFFVIKGYSSIFCNRPAMYKNKKRMRLLRIRMMNWCSFSKTGF
jgi:hypothetical protein